MFRNLFLLFIIVIANHFCFASNDSIYLISKINISGNRITHNNIIIRELSFKKGDSLSKAQYEIEKQKSAENLMNISLFNFVTITEIYDENKININIHLIERWYIWPIPVFDLADRNFNTWWKTKDFDRVNYGIDLAIYNFRGRNETLDLLLSLGYDQKYGFAYKIPYINKKQSLGLTLSGNFIQSHEIALKDSNNKVVFFKRTDIFPKKNINAALGISFRNNIHNSHFLELGFDNYDFNDSIIILNPEYSVNKRSSLNFFSIYYQYKNDYRDYKPYPLKGHYFDIEVSKYGLALLNDEVTNLISIKSSYRKYFQLRPDFYFASGITAMINSEFPYFIQNGLGYIRDYVRGYEYYVVNGQSFALIKNNLKYAIVPQRVSKINAIKTEKFNTIPYAFYLNLYADAAYVYQKQNDSYNSLVNKLLIGYGLGIDFVTYYDKVIRLEYSVNKSGEKGIYIHFMTSI